MPDIDPEFKDLIPPLTSEEYDTLESSIIAEGCRDAIVLWGNVIVDGHNRYTICRKHGIPFNTVQKEFPSRNDAIVWIIKNQFGRRNLPAYERARLALRLKPVIAEKAKERQGERNDLSNIGKNSCQCSQEAASALREMRRETLKREKSDEIQQIKDMKLGYDAERNVIAGVRMEISNQIRRETKASEMHIYFARIGDKMKVGSSADVENRLRQLKVSAPDIVLVGDVYFGEEAKKHENNIKKKFAEYNISGEVYRYSDKLLREMMDYTKQEADRNKKTDVVIAHAAGVSHDTIAKVEKLEEKATDEMKQRLRSGDISINNAYLQIKRQETEERREAERKENAAKVETLSTPLDAQGLFQTIVIDPPWDWGDEGDVNQFGRAKPDYHTMPIEDIKALPIGKIADENCHIYLWVTNRSLPKAFDLLEAWGFRYITCLTWVKPSIGMGNYFRGNTEQILFGVKGKQPLKRHDVGTSFTAPRGDRHSAKPDEFYRLVESCSYGPYIDIFGRKGRDGWSVWGENG